MVSEVISTVERRRRWPTAEKLRIMSESLEPGATVAAVADRNGVCRSQIYTWLREARNERLAGISLSTQRAGFVPARIEPPEKLSASNCQPRSTTPAPDIGSTVSARGRRPVVVEVLLTNGRIVKVDEYIDPDNLARLLAVLEGDHSC